MLHGRVDPKIIFFKREKDNIEGYVIICVYM